MKLAVTVWGNRVSPVFDAASTLLVAEIKNRSVLTKNYHSFNPATPSDLVKILEKLGVSVLMCGAISTRPADLIVENQIQLVSFVTGNALQLIEDFAKSQTIEKAYMMPGCSKEYNRHKRKEIRL